MYRSTDFGSQIIATFYTSCSLLKFSVFRICSIWRVSPVPPLLRIPTFLNFLLVVWFQFKVLHNICTFPESRNHFQFLKKIQPHIWLTLISPPLSSSGTRDANKSLYFVSKHLAAFLKTPLYQKFSFALCPDS